MAEDKQAAAYRVAHLLQRDSRNSADLDTSALRRLTAQIGSFLEVAPQVPPVYMEGGQTSGAHDASAQEVELSVVAGVFEEKAPLGDSRGQGGLLMPTEATRAELHARRVEEAQALLNLMSALAPSSTIAANGAAMEERHNCHDPCDVESDDAESEVAVMDADDLANEETSDDEMPAQRRRVIEEMN